MRELREVKIRRNKVLSFVLSGVSCPDMLQPRSKKGLYEYRRDQGCVLLPFGTGIDLKHFRFRANVQQDKVAEIEAVCDSDKRRAIIIYPPYECVKRIRTKKHRAMDVRIWSVCTDIERATVQRLILRNHYLTAPSRGFILACAFVDSKTQEGVRKVARGKRDRHSVLDPWSSSWDVPPGGIVGCAILDTLWFGNPRGRDEFVGKALRDKSWRDTFSRSEVVRKARIAWASRFAVDAPYRGLGVGTLLAAALKEVAVKYRAPAANFIEVLTTVPRTDEVKKRDFLSEAGYTYFAVDKDAKTFYSLDEGTGVRLPEPGRSKYYYVKL